MTAHAYMQNFTYFEDESNYFLALYRHARQHVEIEVSANGLKTKACSLSTNCDDVKRVGIIALRSLA